MMTRKDFRAFAAAIAELPRHCDRVNVATVAAGCFAADNPNFDRARFYEAARVNDRRGDEMSPPE